MSLKDSFDVALFRILVEHDIAISARNQQRTKRTWPDLSDIHINTRERIRELCGESYDEAVAQRIILTDD